MSALTVPVCTCDPDHLEAGGYDAWCPVHSHNPAHA